MAGTGVDRFFHRLMVASMNGHLPCLIAPVAAVAELNHGNDTGWIALFWASRYGDEACVCALVKAGADVNQASRAGQAATLLSCSRATTSTGACVIAGLDANADPSPVNKDGNKDPAHVARRVARFCWCCCWLLPPH